MLYERGWIRCDKWWVYWFKRNSNPLFCSVLLKNDKLLTKVILLPLISALIVCLFLSNDTSRHFTVTLAVTMTTHSSGFDWLVHSLPESVPSRSSQAIFCELLWTFCCYFFFMCSCIFSLTWLRSLTISKNTLRNLSKIYDSWESSSAIFNRAAKLDSIRNCKLWYNAFKGWILNQISVFEI